MQKCPGGEGEGRMDYSGKEGGRGPLLVHATYIPSFAGLIWPRWVCAAVQIVDHGFIANRLLTVSLFSAFNMVGRRGPCSCPRQFLGAIFRKVAGRSTLELFSV